MRISFKHFIICCFSFTFKQKVVSHSLIFRFQTLYILNKMIGTYVPIKMTIIKRTVLF